MEMIREKLSQNITGKYNLSRIINVNEDYINNLIDDFENKNNVIIDNLGHSWTDLDDDNLDKIFETVGNDVDVIFFVDNVKGYKLTYNKNNEELLESIGSGLNCIDEAEVLVSLKTKFEIVDISDGREDVGYVEIKLKTIN